MRPLSRFWPRIAALAVLVLVGWLYFWWVGQNMPHWVLKNPGGYNASYAASVREGHVYMHPAPPEMAKLEDPYDPAQYRPYYSFDLSYYNGYIYSYFSIVPPLLLYLPWSVLTGTHLSEQFGAAFFMILGFGVSLALLAAIRRRYLPQAPAWTLTLAVLVIAIGNLSLLLFWPPYYCQVVQACARFFQVAALGAVYLAFQSPHRTGWWLGVASLSCGLMVVTRPIFLPAVLLLAPVWWVLSRRERNESRDSTTRLRNWKLLSAAIVPLALVGMGQMILNYVRFDSVVEFGTTYQQFGEDLRDIVQFSPAYVPGHVFEHLFHRPTFVRYFPFLTYQAEPMGALVMLPFSWMILFLWTGWRAQPVADRASFGALALATVIAPAGNLLMLSCYYLALVRHQVDFVMPLSFAAALGLIAGAHAWQTHPWRRRLLGFTATTFAAVNLLVTVCFATTIPDQGPLPRLARVLNTPVYWWERLRGEIFTNTLRLEVILPEQRPGVVEPLVYTGVQSEDYVYVRYLSDARVCLGYAHTELGSIESEPFAINPADRRHQLEITLGSLAPAAGHPVFSGWKTAAIERARHQVAVKADGKILLNQHTQFHPTTPGDLWIGDAPAKKLLGKFSGKIVQLERVPLSPSPPLLTQWPGNGVAFNVHFANRRTGRADPILSTGTRGKGDLLFLTYLDETRVQFGIDHWQAGRVLGATVSVPNDNAIHAIELRNTPATATSGSAGKLAVLFDGATVLELPQALFPADPETLYLGLKTFPSATEPIFGSRISDLHPLAPTVP